MSLVKYNEKRNFKSSSEPVGKKANPSKQLEFVIHRHKATQLHYDFRLEMDGVLKSWAVPKGPSMNPADKRLAMMVEDHPYDYRTFEGIIPEGNYGAGIVEIWDRGTYDPVDENSEITNEKTMLDDLGKGRIRFVLNGDKVKGEFALVKMKKADDNAWLLIKHKDGFATDKAYSSENYTSDSSPINKALKETKAKKKTKKGN
jgi:bifunctional non-homologous end joining protein LigD